jgi:hypothetical protein
MGARGWLRSWPIYRQLTGADRLTLGKAAESPHSAAMAPRTEHGRVPALGAGPGFARLYLLAIQDRPDESLWGTGCAA